MKHLEAAIEIAAPPEQVWQVLIDFKRYPEWNPFIIALDGVAAMGEKLREVVRQSDGKQVQFTSRIVIWEPVRHLAWDGYLGAPFLFMGRHELVLDAMPAGTLLIQRETFTGLMIPFLKIETVLPGYQQMNQALKDRVEAG